MKILSLLLALSTIPLPNEAPIEYLERWDTLPGEDADQQYTTRENTTSHDLEIAKGVCNKYDYYFCWYDQWTSGGYTYRTYNVLVADNNMEYDAKRKEFIIDHGLLYNIHNGNVTYNYAVGRVSAANRYYPRSNVQNCPYSSFHDISNDANKQENHQFKQTLILCIVVAMFNIASIITRGRGIC